MTKILIVLLLLISTHLAKVRAGSGESKPSRAHHSGLRVTLKSNFRAANLQPDELTYYATIGIGSPTPQLINVLFDTSTSEIWLPEFGSSPLEDNLHYLNGYNLNNSTSSRRLTAGNSEFAFDYRSSRLSSADFYEDLFTLFEHDEIGQAQLPHPAGQHSFKQNFMTIESASNGALGGKVYDGVIGLAPAGQSSAGIRHVLLSLQLEYQRRMAHEPNQSNVIVSDQSELVFGLWLNHNLGDEQNAGELMLGGTDESHFMGHMYFHSITRYFQWQLKITCVHLGAQLISCPHGCSAHLDTGTSWLVGPRADVHLIAGQLGARQDQNSSLWLIDCPTGGAKEPPALVFRLDQVLYTIGNGYLIERFSGQSTGTCYLALKAWDRPGWLLGTNFMTAYYTVFDFAQRRVGFATPRP